MMDMVKLIGPDGVEGEFPAVAKDALLKSGFTEPMPPAPEAMANTLVGPDGDEVDATALPDAAVQALLTSGFAWKRAEPAPEPMKYLVRGETVMIAAGLPEVAVAAMLENGYRWSNSDAPTAEAAPFEPTPFQWPADDAKVEVLIQGMPSAIEMVFKDARGLVEAGTAKVVGDDELQVRIMDAHDKADDKAVAQDAATGAEAMDPPHAGPSRSLDKGLTEGPNASGKFTHPALPGKEYATKGAVTQALNRLEKEGSASPSGSSPAPATPAAGTSPAAPAAPAEGKEGKLEAARNLLVSTPGLMDDFEGLLTLLEGVAGKRNVGEFDEGELDKLIAKLEEMKEGATG